MSSIPRFFIKSFVLILLFVCIIVGSEIFYGSKSLTVLGSSIQTFSNDDDLCVNENMIDRPGQCEFVKLHCKSEGFINFFTLRYCQFEGKPFPFWFITIITLVVLFYLLGKTSEQFFCPSLCRIAVGLHIPPSVAGVTLLAFGNGSPDIFATIASVQQNELGQALGTIVGGGTFVTSVVVGVVLLASKKKINIPIRPFVRDLLFYFGSVIFLFVICLTGKIYAWQSALFIGYYAAYVLVIILGQYFIKKSKKKIITQMSTTNTISEKDMASFMMSTALQEHVVVDKNVSSFGSIDDQYEDDEKSDEDEEKLKFGVYLSKVGLWAGKKEKKKYDYIQSRDDSLLEEDEIPLVPVDNEESSDEDVSSVPHNTLKGFLYVNYRRFVSFLELEDQSIPSRIFTFVDLPRYIIQRLVIPDALEENYFRPFYILHPLTITIFLFTVFEGWQMHAGFLPGPLWAWILPTALLLCVSIALTSRNLKPPFYEWIFVFISMILSVVWIYFIAQELVSLLSSAGTLLNVSTTIMGLTILAWGNSIGDLVSNFVVSRNGSPAMAIPACYAAPLTNTLLGIGISVTIYVITNKTSFFLLTGHLKSGLFFAFIFLFLIILIALIVVPLWKFHYKKVLGSTLIGVYLVCTALSLLAELGVLKFKIWK